MAEVREVPERLVPLMLAIRMGFVRGVVETGSKWLWAKGERVNRTVQVDELMALGLVCKGPSADGQYTVQLTDRGRAELARRDGSE